MRNIAILMFAVALLLTGSVVQEYEQTADREGDSVMKRTMAVSMLSTDIDSTALGNFCAENPDYGCMVENGMLEVEIALDTENDYYDAESAYGLPFIVYTIKIKSVPTDMFSEKTNEILAAAGYEEVYELDPLEIWREDSESASLLRTFGDISYNVIMPGEVVEANVGETSGSTVTFMLSEAYETEGEIIIKSHEVNWGYVLLVSMAVVLIAFALSFLKKKPKPPEEPRRRKKKKRKS